MPHTELFFIYDTHCPWSYATTQLINEVAKTFPEIKLNLWHCAHYNGDESVNPMLINAVKDASQQTFADSYIAKLSDKKDSTMAANLMAWTENKAPHSTLALLDALQEAHFVDGNGLTNKDDFSQIISQLKLSPPNKVFTKEKLTQDAEVFMHEIFSLQEIIGTTAIPALLLAIDDNLILMNHNLYLPTPKSIVDAIEIELKNK